MRLYLPEIIGHFVQDSIYTNKIDKYSVSPK